MWYRTRFKVLPLAAGRFPIDMLRYNACYPRTEQDAGKIAGTFYPRSPREAVEVELERLHDGREHRLTDERWRSFGWAIVPASVTTEKA